MIPWLSKLTAVMHDFIVPLGWMVFLLFALFIFINRKTFIASFKKLSPLIWWLLIGLFVVGLIIRLTFPGGFYHKIYIDGPWYLEAAKNITTSGLQGNYSKSIGWPLFLAIPFWLLGASNSVAFGMTVFLGALSPLLLFFIIKKIINDCWLAALGSLFLLFNPVHIFWSTSAETNVPALFFILLAISLWLFYFQKPSLELLLLSLAAAAMAALFRPENILLFFFFLLGNWLFTQDFFRQNKWKIVLTTLVLLLLVLPGTLAFFTFFSDTPHFKSSFELYSLNGPSVANWSPARLLLIARTQLIKIFLSPSLLLSVFAFLGLIIGSIRRKKIAFFSFTWFAFFFAFYLVSWYPTILYNANINHFLNESRFYLVFLPATTILAILSFEWLAKKAREKGLGAFSFYFSMLVLALGLIGFQNFLSFQKMAALNEEDFTLKENKLLTQISQQIKSNLPAGCVIIAPETSVLTSVNDIKTLQMDQVISDPSLIKAFDPNGCLLFFEDKYCLTNLNTRTLNAKKAKCRAILDNYNFQPYKSFSFKNLTYNFYKLEKADSL